MNVNRFFFTCVIILSGVLVCSGCGKSPDELYADAKSLIGSRETIDDGLQCLVEFEQKYPDDPRAPEVLLTIATVHQSKQDFDNAIAAYESLFRRYPGTAEEYKGRFLLGYLYFDELRDPARAGAIFRDFIDAYPDSELTVSAQVLLENIDQPIEEWPVIKALDQSIPEEPVQIHSSGD